MGSELINKIIKNNDITVLILMQLGKNHARRIVFIRWQTSLMLVGLLFGIVATSGCENMLIFMHVVALQ